MKDQQLRDDLKQRIEKIIRFRSTSSRPAELKACARWIRKEILKSLPRGHNVQLKIISHNNVPSVVAVQGKWKHPQILLNGHFDVVPGKDEQFRPEINGDKIIGRGAADMKAGVASMMTAFINTIQQRPDLSIGLMLTGDEEVGGADGAGYLVGQGWKTDVLVNFDGGYCEEISHAEKGILRIILSSHGKSGRVHYPWEGDCALDRIMDAYQRLNELFPGRLTATAEDNWHTTFSPKGVVTEPNNNSIVDFAELKISVHFVEDKTPREMVQMIRAAMPGQVSVKSVMEVPRVYVDPQDTELVRFQNIYKDILGHTPAIREENGSSDARFFSHMNIPMIITKPKSRNPEQDNEWVSFASTLKLTKALETYLLSH